MELFKNMFFRIQKIIKDYEKQLYANKLDNSVNGYISRNQQPTKT